MAKMTIAFRLLLALFVSIVALIPGWAQTRVEELTGAAALPKTFQVDKPYTITLRYTDPKGDSIKKADCLFIDQGPSGRTSTPATKITGSPETGADISWELNKLEQGAHTAHFEIKNESDTVTRYPEDEKSSYQFVVEAVATKVIVMVVGLLVALLALPLIVYLMARAMNPRGDPSRAARMGLLIGILSSCALFIYLFLSLFGPLVWAILIVGAFAAIVLMLRR